MSLDIALFNIAVCAVFLLVGCTQEARGQTEPDTLQWQRYFPMAAGNVWEYRDVTGGRNAYRLEIKGDTLIDDTSHVTYEMMTFDEDQRLIGRWMGVARYTTTGTIEGLDVPHLEDAPLFPSCIDLRADFRSTLLCGAALVEVEALHPEIRLQESRYAVAAVKKFESDTLVYAYAADIGPYFWRMERDGRQTLKNLVFAKVGDRTYGTSRLPAVGQDTLDWRRYYPLAVGNEWQHTEIAWGAPIPTYHRLRIVGESVVEGVPRFRYLKESFNTVDSGTTLRSGYLWYDSTGFVRDRSALDSEKGDTTWLESETLQLSAAFGDTLRVAGVGDVVVFGGYDREIRIGSELVETDALKDFHVYFSGIERGEVYGRSYAANLGLLNATYWDGPTMHLSYARIDGREYGEKVVTLPTEAPVKVATGTRIVEIYPNPFQNAVTIEYVLSRPAQVVLEIFDPLGRQVMQKARERRQPGRHTWRADLLDLAPGLYIVRLRDPTRGEADMRAVTRIR